MTTITIPNRPKPSDLRDINAILANFDAITAVVNGNLDSSNIKDGSLKGTDLEAGTVAEDRLAAAVQTLLNKALTGLSLVTKTTNYTAVTGDFVSAQTAGITITLPTPTINRSVGVFAGAVNNIKVKPGSGLIYGDFVNGASSIVLNNLQHVVLLADGANWIILSGEPAREQAYEGQIKRAADTEFEPNASRPTFVTIQVFFSFEAGSATVEVTVGGQYVATIANGGSNSQRQSFSFIVPAGKKWKWHGGGGSTISELVSQYLYL